jgi:hypothetical protein
MTSTSLVLLIGGFPLLPLPFSSPWAGTSGAGPGCPYHLRAGSECQEKHSFTTEISPFAGGWSVRRPTWDSGAVGLVFARPPSQVGQGAGCEAGGARWGVPDAGAASNHSVIEPEFVISDSPQRIRVRAQSPVARCNRTGLQIRYTLSRATCLRCGISDG